ncbi:MAG: SAM-dependent methyltransferase, partial [Actinomycetota bacterium]|nr:SAM-dependent methyltransferase [Actinomycetota bacterium]
MQQARAGVPLPLSALRTPAGRALLDALPPYDEAAALEVTGRLRAQHPPELVAAALTQARLRARAREKFGEAAERLWFTPGGLEQATRPAVAALRARRYTAAGSRRVADLCCG